jgi:hypothetical protein
VVFPYLIQIFLPRKLKLVLKYQITLRGEKTPKTPVSPLGNKKMKFKGNFFSRNGKLKKKGLV